MDCVVDTQLELYNTSWLQSLEAFVYILGTSNLVFNCHPVCWDGSPVCMFKSA